MERSNLLYEELVKNEIIPAIERESAEVLSPEELTIIAAELDTVVEQFSAKIETTAKSQKRKELRSKRKTPKKFKKTFQDFAERKAKYQKHFQILGNRNSYSKTDVDATFMRMKEDHMRNGQLKPEYNVQIATNHQYVLGYDVFPNPTDTRTLRPFLETLQHHFLPALPTYIVANAGYGSEENYQTILDQFERTPLITYATYLKEQKKKFRQNPFQVANWLYQEQNDTYIYPNGQTSFSKNTRHGKIDTDLHVISKPMNVRTV